MSSPGNFGVKYSYSKNNAMTSDFDFETVCGFLPVARFLPNLFALSTLKFGEHLHAKVL